MSLTEKNLSSLDAAPCDSPLVNWNAIRDYARLARVDHWFKNVFMLPGTALAILFLHIPLVRAVWPTLIAILSTCLLASANYVINEWLDAEFDRHHPRKRFRPSAAGRIKASLVALEYLALMGVGLALAALLSPEFVFWAVALLVMGVLYNVRPFRLKDKVYLDVLTESVNNPLRLLLGWSAIAPGILPPSSSLLTYWFGGAFLMAVKRYAEYRSIGNPKQAALYRRSLGYYTEKKLLLSAFFYALTSALFLGVFLIKYRIEFLLTFPLFALLFVWYLALGMRPHSTTQHPEKLYLEKGFLAYVVVLCVTVFVLFIVDIPSLQVLTESVIYR
jgi:4-hydroxybenzoate polyprenyltransferase